MENIVNIIQSKPPHPYQASFQPTHRPYKPLYFPSPTPYPPTMLYPSIISSKQCFIPRPYTSVIPAPHQTTSPNHQTTNPPTLPLQVPPRVNNASNPPAKDRPFSNFHMSNSELFGHMCGQNLLAPHPGKTVTAPYPCWYDPNLSCEYHSNTSEHSIENCYGFKHDVWRLIDTKAIQLKETE